MSDQQREAIGTISVAPTYNLSFCRRFVRLGSDGWKIGSYGTKEKEVLSIADLDRNPPFARRVSGPGNLLFRRGTSEFDFDNDGSTDTVVNIPIYPGRGYNLFLVKPGGASADEIAALDNVRGYESETYTSWARQNAWAAYSGEGTPYGSQFVEIMPIRIQGTTYVLALPNNSDAKPSAVVLRVRANEIFGRQSDRWETVCAFQMIEENF